MSEKPMKIKPTRKLSIGTLYESEDGSRYYLVEDLLIPLPGMVNMHTIRGKGKDMVVYRSGASRKTKAITTKTFDPGQTLIEWLEDLVENYPVYDIKSQFGTVGKVTNDAFGNPLPVYIRMAPMDYKGHSRYIYWSINPVTAETKYIKLGGMTSKEFKVKLKRISDEISDMVEQHKWRPGDVRRKSVKVVDRRY